MKLSFISLSVRNTSRCIWRIRWWRFSTNLFFVILMLVLTACEKQTTPVKLPGPQLSLAVEDVLVTEAWIALHAEDIAAGQEVIVWRDSSEIFRQKGFTGDSLLYDWNLNPGHNYTYRAELWQNGNRLVQSESATAAAMDTTTHNFTWQIDTVGTHSSVLLDVAIVNENDIWAVGKIHTAETDTFDSLGNWIPPYNAVHWDGSEWELKRITYDGSFWTIESVFAFFSNDIWFSAFVKWNGTNFIELPIPNVLIGYGINKIWGTSSTDFYVVGTQGLIAHYNGSDWHRIETGIEIPIQDVWGLTSSPKNEPQVIAVASEKFVTSERIIIQLEPQYSLIHWPFPDRRIHSVWFANRNRIWICGAGIFRYHHQQWKEFSEVPLIFTNRIRGNADNDVFVAGDFGIVAHYNGLSWKVYPDVNAALYESLDVKGDLMVAVGSRNGRGYILRMYR